MSGDPSPKQHLVIEFTAFPKRMNRPRRWPDRCDLQSSQIGRDALHREPQLAGELRREDVLVDELKDVSLNHSQDLVSPRSPRRTNEARINSRLQPGRIRAQKSAGRVHVDRPFIELWATCSPRRQKLSFGTSRRSRDEAAGENVLSVEVDTDDVLPPPASANSLVLVNLEDWLQPHCREATRDRRRVQSVSFRDLTARHIEPHEFLGRRAQHPAEAARPIDLSRLEEPVERHVPKCLTIK